MKLRINLFYYLITQNDELCISGGLFRILKTDSLEGNEKCQILNIPSLNRGPC
jgi:hypothetical protein